MSRRIGTRVWAVVDLFKRDRVRGERKPVWVLVIIFLNGRLSPLPFVGPSCSRWAADDLKRRLGN